MRTPEGDQAYWKLKYTYAPGNIAIYDITDDVLGAAVRNGLG